MQLLDKINTVFTAAIKQWRQYNKQYHKGFVLRCILFSKMYRVDMEVLFSFTNIDG